MFYPVSKILTALALPSSLVALMIGLGAVLMLATRRDKLGRRLLVCGLVLMPLLGIVPVGNVLILPLEQRAAEARPPGDGERFAGIIILGGFEDGWVSGRRPGLAINESGERLTEGLRLAYRYPQAKVIFSGGSGAFLRAGLDAATPVGRYLADVGIVPDRIVLEAKSRNTHENALFTRDLVKPQADQRWLLVTSAYHMPRSLGIFRQAGFDVQPYPVDFRTRGVGDALRLFETIPDGMKRVDLAAREWVGLLVYWLTGRSNALWPQVR